MTRSAVPDATPNAEQLAQQLAAALLAIHAHYAAEAGSLTVEINSGTCSDFGRARELLDGLDHITRRTEGVLTLVGCTVDCRDAALLLIDELAGKLPLFGAVQDNDPAATLASWAAEHRLADKLLSAGRITAVEHADILREIGH